MTDLSSYRKSIRGFTGGTSNIVLNPGSSFLNLGIEFTMIDGVALSP